MLLGHSQSRVISLSFRPKDFAVYIGVTCHPVYLQVQRSRHESFKCPQGDGAFQNSAIASLEGSSSEIIGLEDITKLGLRA